MQRDFINRHVDYMLEDLEFQVVETHNTIDVITITTLGNTLNLVIFLLNSGSLWELLQMQLEEYLLVVDILRTNVIDFVTIASVGKCNGFW